MIDVNEPTSSSYMEYGIYRSRGWLDLIYRHRDNYINLVQRVVRTRDIFPSRQTIWHLMKSSWLPSSN